MELIEQRMPTPEHSESPIPWIEPLKPVPNVENFSRFSFFSTCFNRIDLPNYATKEELLERLKTAVTFSAVGFDIE
jgi:hypothetical protein